MSLRSNWPRTRLSLLAALVALVVTGGLAGGCGGGAASGSDEPTTAKDKQRREADVSEPAAGATHKVGRWRYTGDRADCFFVVGGRCFKTEQAACAAAKCGKRACETSGGGPATVACAKP